MHSDSHGEDRARDPRAVLDGWRDSGADRVDPVRFRLVEAMARRAASYTGDAGRLLEARVAELLAAYADMLARAPGDAPPAKPSSRPSTALADLAALREQLGRRAQGIDAAASAAPASATATTTAASTAPPAAASATGASASSPAHPAEPELADYFRDTWARVSVDRQLRQSQAGVPEKAGPLNTNHLVHRSLSLMREVSPGYLEQFLSYVDALAWLEGMHAISLVPDREAPRAPAARKPRAKATK